MQFKPTLGRIAILEKYGISRLKVGEKLSEFKSSIKPKLYEKQGGICSITGIHFLPEEMNLDHIVPLHLLRLLGFDSTERWDERNLTLTNWYANSHKSHRINDRGRFMDLFEIYWDCSLELENFERIDSNHPKKQIMVEYY